MLSVTIDKTSSGYLLVLNQIVYYLTPEDMHVLFDKMKNVMFYDS